ncbi:hypothetical protein [Lederbergia graminis]|uniref:Phosphoribulokinase/uridine kinase domain-containing protein n=1 Tax=Lederbergia graminis TaxID=735518 RepID=A0ABW0LEM6_9BACI
MKKGKLPYVISISGVSGGGKTTITKYLNERLKNSKQISFDDYEFDGPDDIMKWVDQGANYEDWNLAPLVSDIESLLAEPLDYIVLDFPFANKHSKMSNYIDLAIYIDTPLDIAMARRVIRDYSNRSNESILHEMENYLSNGRRGYLEMLKSIKPNSDIIVDGTLPVSKIIDTIYEEILKR